MAHKISYSAQSISRLSGIISFLCTCQEQILEHSQQGSEANGISCILQREELCEVWVISRYLQIEEQIITSQGKLGTREDKALTGHQQHCLCSGASARTLSELQVNYSSRLGQEWF